MTKNLVIVILGVFILIFVGSFSYQLYSNLYGIPANSPKGDYEVTIESGENLATLALRLESENIVNSAQGFIWMERLNPIQSLQTGVYTLTVPAKPESLLKQIDSQTSEKLAEKEKLSRVPTVSITFIEGENLDQYIAKLVKNEIADQAALEEYAKNPANFNTEKFTFLPNPLTCTYGDLKNCAKYYPEGYLYPDTYTFFKPSSPKDIFDKLLNNFYRKVWLQVEDQVENKDDFTRAVILASVLEKETGRTRGVTDKTRDELFQERKTMAGVFYNRLDAGMKWQSDVTAEYGTGRRLCQQTFVVENCMYLDSPLADTKYNTYKVVGYPIAPVTNPQYQNVFAALNPEASNYLFFVSDVTGKKYFAENEARHRQIIVEVNKINRELGL